MRTVVINNREGLVQGQLPHIMGKDVTGITNGEVVTFLPGANLVDSAKLAQLRKNPTFDLNFKTKIQSSAALEQPPEKAGRPILEIDKSIGKNGEVEDSAPLAKLTPEQCTSLIAETFVTDVLRTWLKEEGRPDVRRDIANQIEKLATPANPATAGR